MADAPDVPVAKLDKAHALVALVSSVFGFAVGAFTVIQFAHRHARYHHGITRSSPWRL